MLLSWNNEKTLWLQLVAVFWLSLNVGVLQANAQSAPLPAPQMPPSISDTGDGASNGTDKRAPTGQAAIPKGATDGKLDLNSAIADLLAANPECAELSNNCQICIRKSAADADCSLPGVACSRGTWTCTKTQSGPKPAQ